MMNFLPDLYEGHAPITLQHLFGEALEAFDAWEEERPEPTVIYEDHLVPIGIVFDSMRNCTDLLPRAMSDIISDNLAKPAGSTDPLDGVTFSGAAGIMTELVHKRRLYGEVAMAAFGDHNRADTRRPA
jgi:hypothetical protein